MDKDAIYHERNLLALFIASANTNLGCGWYRPEPDEWRVISMFDGAMTFHVPDDFDMLGLPEIVPNWDGHSTEQKWEWATAVMKEMNEIAMSKLLQRRHGDAAQ